MRYVSRHVWMPRSQVVGCWSLLDSSSASWGRTHIRQRTVQLASRPNPSGWSIGQDAVELGARFDTEFDEDLAQVVLDGARADEQPSPDFRVRQAVPS
jgi:hypothetical protein